MHWFLESVSDAAAASAQYQELAAGVLDLAESLASGCGLSSVQVYLRPMALAAHSCGCHTPAARAQALCAAGGMRARKEAELRALQLAEQELAQLPADLRGQLQGLSLSLHHRDTTDPALAPQVSIASPAVTLCVRDRQVPDHAQATLRAGVGQR